MMCCLCGERKENQLNFCQLLILQAQEASTCRSCLASFERISDQHCPSCFKEGNLDSCQDCRFWEGEGVSVSHQALYRYNDAMKSYFSAYKFEGDYALRQVFAGELKKAVKSYRGYTLVPVPLGPQRLQQRGFNQVEGLLTAGKIPYQDLLEKTDTRASSSKNRKERLESDFHFSIKQGRQLPEKILLFDDVYTTGATLNRIKQMLLEAGCQTICTFSLAR